MWKRFNLPSLAPPQARFLHVKVLDLLSDIPMAMIFRLSLFSGLFLLTSLLGLTVPSLAQSPEALSLPSTSVQTAGDYILGVGDQLDVNVFAYEEFTGQRTVLPDGSIIMPMIGHVPTAGKTTEQLVQEITTRLRKMLVNPVVTINLVALRPVVVNVSGEVQRPGTVQLREASSNLATNNDQQPQQRPTLANALLAAGGITANADIRQVMLKRNGSDTPITINLWDAIQSDAAPPNLILQDGDAIYIPTLQAGAMIDRRLLGRSQFSPATVRVRVVGEVTAPGEVQVPPNSSISSAVAIAGGPTEDANLRRVGFVRMNESGQIEQQELDLRNLSDTNQIQEGDVVIVPKRNSASFVDFAGRLLSPLGILLNLF
jgi:polysaccharide biosynthesis/export protein